MTATPVNKEAIRVLVIQHGQREAARIAGLNENTVRSWAMRYHWSTPTAATKTQPNGHSALVDRVTDELAECERETRLGLARYSKRAAQDAEKASLREAPYVHKAAQVAGIAFKWDAKEQGNNTVVNVAILGIQPADVQVQTLDVESECQDSGDRIKTR